MTELLPSVQALAEKVEGRKALYFLAAAVVFAAFAAIVINNREKTDGNTA